MANGDRVDNAISGQVTGSVTQAGILQQIVVRPENPRTLPVPRQLPPPVRDFVGRVDQLAAMDALLAPREVPDAMVLVVVDGVGGVGKTALVVRWAHQVQNRFPDGTLFANLRGYGPSAPLAPHVALSWFLPALGVAEADIPADIDAQAGLYRSVLAGRRVLVVLDNAAEWTQVRPLLPGTPGCMALVTSRASMTELVVAEAAHRVSLGLFTTTESHWLLRGILGSDRVDIETNAVPTLVRACAGLPLAVRVAATRAAARPQLTIAELAKEIIEDAGRGRDDRFRGASDVGGAVRSVLDWSYRQLPTEQARVFRRLGLHPGPEFGVHVVAALTTLDTVTAYHCLEVLAELHLVEPTGRKRYRMHDLLHAYAAHRSELDESPADRASALRQALTWYARTAQHADRAAFPVLPDLPREIDATGEDISFADRADALTWLRTEHTNLVAAVRCAVEGDMAELAMALASSARFLSYRERAFTILHIDVTTWGQTAARAGHNLAVEAVLLGMRADTFEYVGRLDDAEADFTGILAIADELAEPFHEFVGLCGLGRIRLRANRLDAAREYYLRALAPARRVSGTRPAAVVHANLSQICTRLGQFDQALEHAERELLLRRQDGRPTGEATALLDAARAWLGLGDHERAVRLCQEACAVFRAAGDVGGDMVKAILTLAEAQESSGDDHGAAASLHEAVAALKRLDDPLTQQTRNRLAALESRITNPD